MRKNFMSLILINLFFMANSYSQVKLHALVAFDYSYGFAMGDLKSYIPKEAFDGVNFQYRHFLQRNVTLGARGGWNNFNDVLERNVYETDRGTVSAVQTRALYSMPFLVTGHYYLRSLHYVMPYVGMGLGGYLVNYEKWFGVVPTAKRTLNLGLSPEIGLVIPFKNTGLGLIMNGRFNEVFYSHNEVRNLRYAEATIGLYFGYTEFEKIY